jgi:hypothetical protein
LPTSLVTPARLSSADVVRRRTLIFAGDDPRQEYTIISALFDATLFDAARVAQLVRLGDVEESIPGLAGRQSSDSSGPPHAEGDEG